ncbi:hypothetical protein PLICRDRAFT_695309 [Plicaturopsis crispa FD-325 SS-3]|nr:hypothetical protein PLICRDRAFT_695309 [Plicaturopsis crispa FD-325 SS-3]
MVLTNYFPTLPKPVRLPKRGSKDAPWSLEDEDKAAAADASVKKRTEKRSAVNEENGIRGSREAESKKQQASKKRKVETSDDSDVEVSSIYTSTSALTENQPPSLLATRKRKGLSRFTAAQKDVSRARVNEQRSVRYMDDPAVRVREQRALDKASEAAIAVK